MHKGADYELYNSNNISKQIRFCAKEKGISVRKMLQDIGLGLNTMSNMKTSMPKADNLAKIADYLECSVDYLLDRTNNPNLEIKKSFPPELSEEKQNLINLYDKLTVFEQGEVIGYIKRIIEEHKHNPIKGKGA